VRWIDKVLEVALVNPLTPLADDAAVAETVVAKSAETAAATDPVIKH
jgi:ATP-dependent Lon protease